MPQPKVPTAKYNLSNINVVEIADACVPAVPSATFAVFKADSGVPVEKQVSKIVAIIAKDAVKKQTFGYVLVPGAPDWQGDVVTKEDVEQACHSYLKNGFTGAAKGKGTSLNHADFEKTGYPIESGIDIDGSVAKSHGVPEDKTVAGGWWFGKQHTDESWDRVEKGEVTGFSIGGFGERTPIETETSKGLVDTVVAGIQKIIGAIRKEDTTGPVMFNDALKEEIDDDKLWELSRALQQSIRSILESQATNKSELLSTTIDQYKAAMMSFVTATKSLDTSKFDALEKAFTEIIKAKGDKDMADTQMDKVLAELAKISGQLEPLKDVPDRLTALETFQKSLEKKPDDPPKPDDNEANKSKSDDKGGDVDLAKKITDLEAKITKLETTPGPRSGNDDDSQPVKKTDPESIKRDRQVSVGKGLLGTESAKATE